MRLPRSSPAPSRCPRKWSRSTPPIIACSRATSPRGGRSRRRRCRRWTAMRCARPMPPTLSARLKVIGEVAAGRPFERKVGAGEAVRIFTGGVIPDGADAVIIQEDTGVDGDHITITEAAVPGRHIRPAGVDFREGDVLLARGRRLTDRDLSLAAGMNYPELAGAPPPEGRRARHRRRAGDAGRDPRPRPDRLFQRLRACGRWRAPRAPRSSISASPPTRSPPPRKASAARARPTPTS